MGACWHLCQGHTHAEGVVAEGSDGIREPSVGIAVGVGIHRIRKAMGKSTGTGQYQPQSGGHSELHVEAIAIPTTAMLVEEIPFVNVNFVAAPTSSDG